MNCSLVWAQCWLGFGLRDTWGTSSSSSPKEPMVVVLWRAVPGHLQWCLRWCARKNDLHPLQTCWWGDPSKLPKGKKKIFHITDTCGMPRSLLCFIWWSPQFLLPYAIPGRCQGWRASSNSTVKLQVSLQFLFFPMPWLWGAAVRAMQNICGPSTVPPLHSMTSVS